jgi:hypothetical protein
MALTLPPSSDSQIALRVHRMRVARGACWVIALALIGASALTLIDAVALLPSWVRGLGLAIWLTGFGVLVWFFVLRRLSNKASRNAAQAAAKELPENIQAATAAVILIVGCLIAAVFVPNAVEHIRRVAVPWHRPAADQYRIVVTSKEPIVRSGDSITLSAYAEKLDPSVPNAEHAILHCRDLSGNDTSLRMTGDEAGAFHATCPSVTADFKYRVEVEGVPSDWFHVTVIQPAEPTPQSTMEITPPKYAIGIVPPQTVTGFASFSGIQYGSVGLNVQFSRPAAKAYLEWQAEPSGVVEAPFIALSLASDSLSGTAAFQLKQDGVLRLVTFTERNGKTLSCKYPVAVRVITDRPPRLERVRGVSSRPRSVHPGQSLAIEITAVDDIAIGSAAIEYAIGSDVSRPATLPISLSGSGMGRTDGRLDFDLPGKLREGETVRYRIRVADVRQVSEPELKPQEIVYPKAGWSIVKVNPTAPPIDQQEIEGQRDEVGKGLDTALDEIKALIAEIRSLRSETSGRFELHHQVILEKIRERQRELNISVLELAQNTALTVELRSFASAIQAVAERQLLDAEAQYGKALTEKRNNSEMALSDAIKHLTTAAERIDQLKIRNQQLAQARLDCKKLEAVMADQSSLASRLKPEGKTPVVELAMLQRELNARLAKAIAESTPLREAVADARKNALVGFANQISDLAKMLSELDTSIKQLETEVRKGMLGAVAAEVAAVSKDAAVLLNKLELATRLVGVNAPKPEEFARVVNLIGEGKTLDALTELQRLHGALEAVAIPLEKWVNDSADPKFAIRQFANWLEDLRVRYNTATNGKDENFKALPQLTQTAFHSEQKVIHSVFASILLPPSRDLAVDRALALANILKVDKCLAGSGADTDAAMKDAVDSLNRLAGKIPAISERLTKARSELDDLQKEQEQILTSFRNQIGKPAFTTQDSFPPLVKKMAPLAIRQRKQLATLSALDLPGLEARRTRILAALAAAIADLEAGLPHDAFASQTWANREIERLKMVLDRLSPPEERVDELARRLETANNGFLDIHKQLSQISAAEAVALRNDAATAILAVDGAYRDASKREDRPQLLKLAVTAMRKLSDRLVGGESELERVQRLAGSRHLAAMKAEKLKGTATNRADSDEASRQLGREVDEFLCTRVGMAGQLLKQRALEQYEKLKAIGEPDHAAGLQKTLAETLDELAGLMADVNELTVVFPRVPPAPASTEADNYLPSRQFVDSLRQTARQQQLLRERLNHLPVDLLKAIEASEGKPAHTQKKTQMESLINKSNELAAMLQHALSERGQDDSLNAHFAEARLSVIRTAKLLAESKDKVKKGQRDEAQKCRTEALIALQNEAARIKKAAPEPITPNNRKNLAITEALLRADLSMRHANELLADRLDLASAQKAMQDAIVALKTAVENRMRSEE